MDPPKINYINNKTLMVVNPSGKMRELFVPLNVQVLKDTEHFKAKSWLDDNLPPIFQEYETSSRHGCNKREVGHVIHAVKAKHSPTACIHRESSK